MIARTRRRAVGGLLVAGLVPLAVVAVPAGAQSPPGSLQVEAAIAPSTGATTRTVTVRATGVAPSAQRLHVSWDNARGPCPADLAGLPRSGGWVFEDDESGDAFVPVGPGPFDLSRAMDVEPGRLRLCGYLDDASGASAAPVALQSVHVLPDPAVRLTRAAAVDALLSSVRVHPDVRRWILEGELEDRRGLGVNGSIYLRLRDLTGDGMPEAIARPSDGGAGRPQAYYIVTNDDGTIRVVAAVRKALDGRIEPLARGYREVIPRYAAGDAPCCASKLSIRTFRWTGARFEKTGSRTVRTRYWTP